ncbi:MAG: hemerythrin domain-containing protein [Bacteroidales bacterium]|nr:hemerythrin domain-containing protein [Bacteroidales bacterium]
MADLIADDYRLIQVMSRFGIRVGFGNMTVREVCDSQNVDCNTFLAVVNFITDDNIAATPATPLSLDSLLGFLKSSHSYFLEYCFPAIRRKLLEGIRIRTSDVSFLILKMYDEYVDEVRTHMEYEDRTVFSYISGRLEGAPADNTVTTYSDHHEQVADKLRELKGIILRYCPEDADVNLLNAALSDIYRTEKELESHCLVEDCLLVPAIRLMEQKKQGEYHHEEE